jgi:anti-sigma regulatory factor (Ser/Thr protein kinase)
VGEILNESSISWFEVLVLPPDHAGASEARAFVGAHLVSHDLLYLIDDIQLVVSELATNALVHGQPPVIVTIEEQRLDVLVTVSDESPELPLALPRENVTASSGRGLSIVELVSSEWGTNIRLDGGKSVWARFDKETCATTPARSQAQPA